MLLLNIKKGDTKAVKKLLDLGVSANFVVSF